MLAGWAIVALLVVTSITLAVVAATGVGIAGSESTNLDLVGVTIGVLVLTVAVGGLFVQRRALIWALSMLVALARFAIPRLGVFADSLVEQFVDRLNAVSLSPVQTIVCLMWGFFNWILD